MQENHPPGLPSMALPVLWAVNLSYFSRFYRTSSRSLSTRTPTTLDLLHLAPTRWSHHTFSTFPHCHPMDVQRTRRVSLDFFLPPSLHPSLGLQHPLQTPLLPFS